MKIKSNMEQAEIFVFIACFFLIVIGFNNPSKTELPEPPKQDEPPIILIRDADQYKFASGSAELSDDFQKYINTKLAKTIEEEAKKYDVDVIEIIGHTDGEPVGNIASNLDMSLEKANLGSFPVADLKPGSNADLGLMRALAVVRELKTNSNLSNTLKFRAYSAGQLILTDGSPAPENREENTSRRRIEIRFTRLGEEKKVN